MATRAEPGSELPGDGADLPALRRRLAELESSESLYREFFDSSPVALSMTAADGRLLRVNRALSDLLGYESEALQTLGWMDITHPEDRAASAELVRALKAGERQVGTLEKRYVRRDGSTVWASVTTRLIRDAPGRPDYFLTHILDISERRRQEAALAFRSDFESLLARLSFRFLVLREGDWLEAIRDSLREFGALLGVEQVFLETLPDEDPVSPAAPLRIGSVDRLPVPSLDPAWMTSLAGEEAFCCDVANAGPWLDAGSRSLLDAEDLGHLLILPLRIDQHRLGVLGLVSRQDPFRGERRSNGLLRMAADLFATTLGRVRSQERERELERRFLQAQRMESIGRLAGSVAHDFNNLLTVINNYAELAMDEHAEDPELCRDLLEIRKAGARASSLTLQLLAFSRRQVLQPQRMDPNTCLREMETMLRRLIGEDIELCLELDESLGAVCMDPGKFSQVVMNLVVNARDAMPRGGCLLLATDRVEGSQPVACLPGPLPARTWVRVTVADTGTGIPETIREHLFEPFFTTKPAGKGTGLGLATVFGILVQSGGGIQLESQPGQGTVFRFLLPLEGQGQGEASGS